jgi:large subunit ribosomal protein L23
MADITDIKSIVYTEKALNLQVQGVLVVQTSPKVTKNQIKEIFKDYFGIKVLGVNSLRQSGKSKRFRGIAGKRNDYKKFYVSIPEDAKIESLSV